MFTRLTVSRLEAYSVYKIFFVGLSCSMVPLGIVFGIMAAFGANTVTWNGQPLHGVQGLLASPFIGMAVTLFVTATLGTACALGLWLYSKFRPLSIWAKNVTHHDKHAA